MLADQRVAAQRLETWSRVAGASCSPRASAVEVALNAVQEVMETLRGMVESQQ